MTSSSVNKALGSGDGHSSQNILVASQVSKGALDARHTQREMQMVNGRHKLQRVVISLTQVIMVYQELTLPPYASDQVFL